MKIVSFGALLFFAALPAATAQDWRTPGSQRRAVEGDPYQRPQRDLAGEEARAEEAERAQRQRDYDAARALVDGALQARNWREALRLLLNQQKLRDGPNVQNLIGQVQALIQWDDARAIEAGGDAERALAAYQSALSISSTPFTDNNRRYVAVLAARVAAEREKREAAAKEKRDRPIVDQACAEARTLVETRPEEALAKLAPALALMPSDPTANGLKFEAQSAKALREQDYDAALNALEEARGWGSLDDAEKSRRVARIKEARQREGAGVTRALDGALQRLEMKPTPVDESVPLRATSLLSGVPELMNSPAADRISKGMQAVIDHDWPVALAWWKQALERDPANASLQRSVDLAQWMVDRKKAVAAGPATLFGEAIHAAAHGASAEALAKLEKAKADNPAVGAQADQLIAEIRKRPSSAPNPGAEVKGFYRSLGCQLYMSGLEALVAGHRREAEQALADSDHYTMGLKPDQRSWEVKVVPPGGCRQIPGTSKLEFERE